MKINAIIAKSIVYLYESNTSCKTQDQSNDDFSKLVYKIEEGIYEKSNKGEKFFGIEIGPDHLYTKNLLTKLIKEFKSRGFEATRYYCGPWYLHIEW